VSTEQLNSEFLIMVNRRLWRGPSTALLIDRDLDLAENVEVLKSTLVMLYRAMAPIYSAVS